MDHQEALRLTATERYLMEDLSPELREQFEEHFFECSDCALDLRATSAFIEQTKRILGEKVETSAIPEPAPVASPAGWFSWFRPAFAVPVFALLLAIVAYQNFFTYPHLRAAAENPRVVPWASINARTRGGDAAKVAATRDGGFVLFVSVPPDARFSQYFADLYDSSGKFQWSVPISAQPADDTTVIEVPAGNQVQGSYSLVLRGIDSTGQSNEISRKPFELQMGK
jgi:hypothetical protein